LRQAVCAPALTVMTAELPGFASAAAVRSISTSFLPSGMMAGEAETPAGRPSMATGIASR